jgi:protease-4
VGNWAPQNQAYAEASGNRPLSPAYASATQYQAVGAQEKKGGRGWIVAIVVVVCLCALVAFTVKTCTDSMSSLADFSTSSTSSLANLTGDAVAVLEVDGTIQYDDSACSPEGFKKLLDQAQNNEHVKALVIRVNSGGGTATAGEEMAEYLRQFDKPVVVSSASINASAAYEISAQADYIYVAKSTEIGAIGTVMQVTDLSGLFEKLGIRMETIASADSKDSSYGYRPLTDDEREYYQHMIDQINEMFIENVAEGRHMDVEKVRKLATGLVFTGVDAVENGLADAVGTREDAVKKAAELAGITDYTTADLSFSTYDLGELAYLLGNDRSTTDELIELLHEYGQTDAAH